MIATAGQKKMACSPTKHLGVHMNSFKRIQCLVNSGNVLYFKEFVQLIRYSSAFDHTSLHGEGNELNVPSYQM